MEAGRSVNAVDVEQSHGGHVELETHCCQFLGYRCALEKGECRASMKLDVRHQFSVPSSRFSVKKTVHHRDTEAQRRQRKISPVVWKVFTETENSVITSFHKPPSS